MPVRVKPLVTLADLERIDVRVGTIIEVLDVPESGKLVRLRVDFGDHERSVLVGMKQERVDPAGEITGRQALFVVNMEPRRMAGQISEALLFDIGFADGVTPVLAIPERPVPNGTRAG